VGGGVAVFDYNNDGYRDLFLSTEGGLRNLLFLNKQKNRWELMMTI
jgi:hypothetical protein